MKGSWIRSTSPPGFVLWLGILAVASVIALGPVRDARADYTPVRWGIVSLGPNPAIVWNQGTALSASDAVSAWNFWMGVSKLSEGSTGCGITKPCVVFANDGAVLSGTSCVVPQASNWAVVWVLSDSHRNFCFGTPHGTTAYPGTDAYPVYVVALNNELSFTSVQLQHIRRHETGHALQLGDTSGVACWFSTVWYPLMNNGLPGAGSCTAYPQNATPSTNEKSSARTWSDW